MNDRLHESMHEDALPTDSEPMFSGSEDPKKWAAPNLVFEEYFKGPVRGWGLFQDRFGKVRTQFTLDMNGHWDGDLFLLDEFFRFSDGKTSNRQWQVTCLGDGRYEARADDIIGAARGRAEGNHINWKYRLAVPVGGRDIRMSFDDHMYLQEDGMLMNVTDAFKFGIKLGRLTVAYRRQPSIRGAA